MESIGIGTLAKRAGVSRSRPIFCSLATLYGTKERGSTPHDPRRKPAELDTLQTIKAAESAVRNGADKHGVAASLLYVFERNRLLERLRQDVERYLRGGQSEQPHSLLLRRLEQLDPQGTLPVRL